jgi:hypothetical protein
MSHVNEAERFNPKENQNNNPLPSKQLIDLFEQSLKQAKESTSLDDGKEPPTKTMPEKTNAKNTKKDASFELNHHENPIQPFFQEMGISHVQQIEKIIIDVCKKIQDHLNNPVTEHYTIVLNDAKQPFKIDVTKHKQETSLKLTCDPTLHALLTQYLPDLKTHLRKKSIEISDILLELDEDTPKKEVLFKSSEKNNI